MTYGAAGRPISVGLFVGLIVAGGVVTACGDSSPNDGLGGANTGNGGGASTTAGGGGGLDENACRGDNDCTEPFQRCYLPGETVGNDSCMGPMMPCAADGECSRMGADFICDTRDGWCGELGCLQGCSASSCPEGQTCAADYRCAPKPCDDVSACPTHFDCKGSMCTRVGCTTDAQCQGFCVRGECYGEPGHCAELPG